MREGHHQFKDYIKLSAREVEILQEIADGHTQQEIGCRYIVTDSTMKSHLEHIRIKLDAKNTAHAVALGIRGGIIQ